MDRDVLGCNFRNYCICPTHITRWIFIGRQQRQQGPNINQCSALYCHSFGSVGCGRYYDFYGVCKHHFQKSKQGLTNLSGYSLSVALIRRRQVASTSRWVYVKGYTINGSSTEDNAHPLQTLWKKCISQAEKCLCLMRIRGYCSYASLQLEQEISSS